jgi:hypothetical protein
MGNLPDPHWRKSSFSFSNGNCLEVATPSRDGTLVRDSKLGGGSPLLAFSAAAWSRFTAGIKEVR